MGNTKENKICSLLSGKEKYKLAWIFHFEIMSLSLCQDFFTESKFDLQRTVMVWSQDSHFLSYGITKRCLMHKRQKSKRLDALHKPFHY